MGVVYLATAPDGRLVAVKVLRAGVVAGAQGRERLAREVQSLRRVRGARVAEVLDADVAGDPPYVVTRFVPGHSLDRVVDEHGPLAGAALHRLAGGLADALASVHEAGIVHRDVKPGNIMLDGGSVVLIDFGLARAVDETRLTTTGQLVGTPGYLAPETVAGHEPTTATDVHGWAATLAYAGTGRAPYGEGPTVAVLDRIRRGDADLERLDPSLQPLVRSALALDASVRPTLAEVRSALRATAAPAGWAGDPVTALLRPTPTRVDLAPRQPAPAHPPAHLPPAHLPPEWPPPPGRPTGAPPPAPSGPATGAVLPRWPLDLVAPPAASGPAALALLAVGGLVVAGELAAPYLTLVLLAAGLLVARTADRLRLRLLRRRLARGPRPSDLSVVAAQAPLRALLGAPLAALQGLVAAAAAGIAAALTWGLSIGPWAPYVAAGVAAVGTAWWGPGGSAVRRGARTLVSPLARHGAAGWVVAGAVVLLAWAVVLVAEEYAVLWWPAAGPPQLWL